MSAVELSNLREDLAEAIARIDELEAENKVICSLLYALGIPSVSEDGYGENVARLRALLDKLQKEHVAACPHGLIRAEAVKENRACANCGNEEWEHWLPF